MPKLSNAVKFLAGCLMGMADAQLEYKEKIVRASCVNQVEYQNSRPPDAHCRYGWRDKVFILESAISGDY